MSCRTDLKTISHYYVDGDIIERYEDGILNRTYLCVRKDITINQQTGAIYRVHYNVKVKNTDKLKKDLEKFLEEFYNNNLQKFFAPIKPK